MYNWDNYDNDMAYSYDDYLEEKNIEAYEDYMVQREMDKKAEEYEEEFDGLEYQSKMAQQLIDSIYEKN